ncbi:metallophosphoesterase domain-containing protein 1-like isoform X1 [Dreissena polymorpha]|uniref:metallophosphoesterase domain-containing protein 1-like isoform X1 n=1 Tax=Dreissena polymorpha TaxID=45954 RepID=UPI00226500B0|nr:metallophosphoesterase domain-containing protein 1-like isoform X1 [Dreissena polymorpha]
MANSGGYTEEPENSTSEELTASSNYCTTTDKVDLECEVTFNKKRLTIVCISDTHSKLQLSDLSRIPPGDILLHAGDFTLRGSLREVHEFNILLGHLPHPVKIVIAGNHEDCLEVPSASLKLSRRLHLQKNYGVSEPHQILSNFIYLEDQSVIVSGLKIYGAPWSPLFYSTAFQLQRGEMLARKWRKIPDDVDILMTHCPPYGICDTNIQGQNCGCEALLHELQTRLKPKFHVFGHIHEGYGRMEHDGTQYINASMCTRKYKPDNPPVVFEIDNPAYKLRERVSVKGLASASNGMNH